MAKISRKIIFFIKITFSVKIIWKYYVHVEILSIWSQFRSKIVRRSVFLTKIFRLFFLKLAIFAKLFFLFRSELVSKNGFFDTSQNVPVNVNMVSIQNDLNLSLIMFLTPWPPSHHQPSISQPQCGTMTTTIQFFQTEDHNKFRKNNLKKIFFGDTFFTYCTWKR